MCRVQPLAGDPGTAIGQSGRLPPTAADAVGLAEAVLLEAITQPWIDDVVEGHGVDPDIEVIDDPALMVDGQDPQLDVAVELMLAEIKRNPYKRPARPEYPNRSGMGIRVEDR